jgi:hypothetical protein
MEVDYINATEVHGTMFNLIYAIFNLFYYQNYTKTIIYLCLGDYR